MFLFCQGEGTLKMFSCLKGEEIKKDIIAVYSLLTPPCRINKALSVLYMRYIRLKHHIQLNWIRQDTNQWWRYIDRSSSLSLSNQLDWKPIKTYLLFFQKLVYLIQLFVFYIMGKSQSSVHSYQAVQNMVYGAQQKMKKGRTCYILN